MGMMQQYADCIILTHDNKILLQQRPENGGAHSGALCAFGGHVEEGENFMGALVRELREELGAVVNPDKVIFLGEFREDDGSVVHIHFWRDKNATITGCYEWEARSYDTVAEALAHPGIMKYAEWALLECGRRGLVA
jgi:8-oxo-dGTP diphosphatase